VGTSITFTATLGGAQGPFEYRWWLREGRKWKMVQDYSANPTFVWTPTRADSGYRIGVWVREPGALLRLDHGAIPFPIKEGAAQSPRVLDLSSDLPPPQRVGTTITFTAVMNGVGAPVEYRWWVRQAGRWVMTRDWSSNSTFVWTPDAPDSRYKIGVWARNVGAVDYEIDSMKFPIGGP
jgi:hypothetical protein